MGDKVEFILQEERDFSCKHEVIEKQFISILSLNNNHYPKLISVSVTKIKIFICIEFYIRCGVDFTIFYSAQNQIKDIVTEF